MLIEQKCGGSNKKKTSQIEAKKLIRKQSLFMPLRYNGAVT